MPVSIMNNIIRDNTDPTAKQINIYGSYEKKVEYSNIEGGYEGEGNIDVDPLFCDSTYCLLTGNESPCIDAGNPDFTYNDVLDGSNALYPALGYARNDMGAFGGSNSKWWEDDMHMWDNVVSVDNEIVAIPTEYKLSQNYPNPFNPSTIIKYQIPKQVRDDNANVSLKVYDILGREIATLVNEKQKAGNYEVTWNADNVPSGIYFYRLRAGNFVEAKKMLLLK